MAWKVFQRIWTSQSRTFKRNAGVVLTSATITIGVAAGLYERIIRKPVLAHAVQQSGRDSVLTTPNKPCKRQGEHSAGCKCGSDTAEPSVKWDSNWDKRDPKSLVPPPTTDEETETYKEKLKSHKSKATRHLILIRHGAYVHKDIPDEEQILTELGREQAEMTGKYLLNLNLKYTKMISSTMTRAIETSDIIHKHLPTLDLKRDEMLCEGRPIVPEPWLHWRPPHLYFVQGARIEAAFRKYFHRADPKQTEDSIDILVCHANVIRYFVCRALQFPPEAWLRIALAHGSITHIMIRPSGHVYLHSLGSFGHMLPGKVTVSTKGQVLW